MDSNYEAQKHLAQGRIDALHEQAARERLLRSARPPRRRKLSGFLGRLFARPHRPRPRCEEDPRPSLAGPERR